MSAAPVISSLVPDRTLQFQPLKCPLCGLSRLKLISGSHLILQEVDCIDGKVLAYVKRFASDLISIISKMRRNYSPAMVLNINVEPCDLS